MMPEDAKKELATDGTGWLLFPREWEGLHEAFPEVPPQCDTRSPLLPTLGHLVWGAAGGVIWNAVRAIQRKPLHHAVLNGIGLVTIPLTAWKATTNEFQRQGAMQDVKAILKADNIALPKRRYVKAVSGSTADSMALTTGGLALSGLLIYRRAPNIAKVGIWTWLGAFTVGQFVGIQVHARSTATPATMQLVEKYKTDLEKGSHIYVSRTAKPPHPYLYGALEALDQLDVPKSSSWSSFPAHAHPGVGGSPVPGDGHDNPTEWLAAQAEPSGSEPHMAFVDQDGKKIVLAQRDFDWNPKSKETGLETLQDHLQDLQKSRKSAVDSAQYLWEMIAKRESEHYAPYGRDEDSEAVNLEKKALELLSSIHRQHYSQIADLDWCIANTQKLILQFQSGGKWLPKKSDLAGVAEAREKLLHSIRTHKKNLEVQNLTIEDSLKVMPVPDEEKEEIKRAVAENLAATAKLLDDLETGTDVR